MQIVFEQAILYFIGIVVAWATWVTIQLYSTKQILKELRTQLFLIDWDKLPTKDLNQVFIKDLNH